jgi:hypothetical protein
MSRFGASPLRSLGACLQPLGHLSEKCVKPLKAQDPDRDPGDLHVPGLRIVASLSLPKCPCWISRYSRLYRLATLRSRTMTRWFRFVLVPESVKFVEPLRQAEILRPVPSATTKASPRSRFTRSATLSSLYRPVYTRETLGEHHSSRLALAQVQDIAPLRPAVHPSHWIARPPDGSLTQASLPATFSREHRAFQVGQPMTLLPWRNGLSVPSGFSRCVHD